MKRHKTARLFWDEDEEKGVTASIIHLNEDDGFTGLYDGDGEPIFRTKLPFGFIGKGNNRGRSSQ